MGFSIKEADYGFPSSLIKVTDAVKYIMHNGNAYERQALRMLQHSSGDDRQLPIDAGWDPAGPVEM